MKREHFFVAALALASLISIGTVAMVANAQTQDRPAADASRVTWEYARLVMSDELVAFHAGETNVVPEAVSLDVLYRRLGGNLRPNLTNLLNAVGNDGWELVTTDESIWTFKRRRQ